MRDTNGKPITSTRVEVSLKISLFAGGLGAVWYILCQPQQILTVFVKNHLDATDIQLGYFVALLNLAGFFHLGAIVLYSFTKRIKSAWIYFSVISRCSAFVISGAALYVYEGGSTTRALWIVMVSSFLLSFVMGNLSGSGWWTWIAALTPEKERAAYFGKRSSLAQMMNIVFFYAATWMLDYYAERIFLIYSIVYLAAGILGLLEVLLHLAVPEPEDAHEKVPFNLTKLLSPVRDRNFLRFAVITGFSVMSINIVSPFQAPFITSKEQIGAPIIWLGIMFIISQLTWVLVVPFWGALMDRMGKKPVVMLGLIYPLSYILYSFINTENYTIILPIISLWTGLFAPAFWEGVNQMMLVLTPNENRTPYIAWFWALMGIVGAAGPLIGGSIMCSTGSLQLTTYASLACLLVSFLIFSTVKTVKDSSLEHVVSMITTPSTYRTFYQLPILSGTAYPKKVHKALKDVRYGTGMLAFDEVCSRMDDPDQTVREEAVFAMGRIGTEAARDVLIQHLSSPDSLIRPEAAKALGALGNSAAVPPLIDALYNGDEELQEECAKALGILGSDDSIMALKQLLREERSERVKITGAQSLTLKGHLDAIDEVIDLWEQTSNRVLQKQLSISLGNIIGKPGEFYRCITGTISKREKAVGALFEGVQSGLKKMEILDSGFIQHILSESIPSIEESFYEEDYQGSFSHVYTTMLNLFTRRLELTGVNPENLDISSYLKKHDSFLFLGFYMIQRFDHMQNTGTMPITSTEILLSLYYLKYYCKKQLSGLKKSKDRKKIILVEKSTV